MWRVSAVVKSCGAWRDEIESHYDQLRARGRSVCLAFSTAMKLFRPHFVIPVASLILGAAVTLFLSVESPPLANVRTSPPSTPQSRHGIPSTPLVEMTPPEHPAFSASSASTTTPRKSTPQPVSDAVARELVRRYGEIVQLAHEPKDLLQKYIDEDTELSGVRSAKFEALKSPLHSWRRRSMTHFCARPSFTPGKRTTRLSPI